MALDMLVTAGLVFGRVVGLVAGMPLFSTQGIPRSVTVLTGLAVTVLVVPSVQVVQVGSLLELAVAMGGELVFGMVMAVALNAVFAAVALGSELMSMQMGLGMATVLDPVQRATNGTIGVLASWLSGLTFLGMGLHHRCLELLASSFAVVPPGQMGLPSTTLPYVAEAVGICLTLGIQLAGPVLVLVWLLNAFVAMLSKLAPKMNVFFSIGLTVTSVAGIALLAFSLPWIIYAHAIALEHAVEGLGQLMISAAP